MSENRLPSNLNAEKTLLGACLERFEATDYAVQKLKPEDFYEVRNSKIFAVISELHKSGKKVDVLTVLDLLDRRKETVMVGGQAYLNDLSNLALTLTNFESYVEIIEAKSMMRSLIISSNEIKEKAESDLEAEEVVEFAEKTIYEISEKRDRGEFESIGSVLEKGMKELKNKPVIKDGLTGITTGLQDVNAILSGFQRSDFVLIAARPSMGKTALGLNFAMNSAVEGDATVGIFSLEMSKWQLAMRMLSAKSLVDLSTIKMGDFTDDEFLAIKEAVSDYTKAKIFIDDTPAISVMEVRSKCRRLKSNQGLDVIIIDYLQLMTGHGENRQQEVSNISRELKALARELDCTVISLSQLSREPDKRTNHRPMMSDLRESGAIEQDADIVLLLYREYYYDDTKPENDAELIIAKHRNGEVGAVDLFWKPEVQLFADTISSNSLPFD